MRIDPDRRRGSPAGRRDQEEMVVGTRWERIDDDIDRPRAALPFEGSSRSRTVSASFLTRPIEPRSTDIAPPARASPGKQPSAFFGDAELRAAVASRRSGRVRLRFFVPCYLARDSAFGMPGVRTSFANPASRGCSPRSPQAMRLAARKQRRS